MKIFTEFIVISNNMPMPSENEFCPSLWQSTDFDSDGDYYWNYPDKKWSYLYIYVCDEVKKNVANLDIWVYRDDSKTMCGLADAHDLSRYIEYKKSGRYQYDKQINDMTSTMITSLRFNTNDILKYEEFLMTVYSYLNHTKGALLNYEGKNAEDFFKEFLNL